MQVWSKALQDLPGILRSFSPKPEDTAWSLSQQSQVPKQVCHPKTYAQFPVACYMPFIIPMLCKLWLISLQIGNARNLNRPWTTTRYLHNHLNNARMLVPFKDFTAWQTPIASGAENLCINIWFWCEGSNMGRVAGRSLDPKYPKLPRLAVMTHEWWSKAWHHR